MPSQESQQNPKEEPKPSPDQDRRPALSTRIWAALAAFGVLGAIGATVFAELWESGKDLVLSPLLVTVHEREGVTPNFLFPASVNPHETPGRITAIEDLVQWAHDSDAVPYGETLLRVIIQGRDAAPVVITDLKIRLLTREPLDDGWVTMWECPQPTDVRVREFRGDLDEPDPRVWLFDPRQPKRRTVFKVSSSEPEVFDIQVTAGTGILQWVLDIAYSTEGRTGVYTIKATDGGPFVTAGGGDASVYALARRPSESGEPWFEPTSAGHVHDYKHGLHGYKDGFAYC